MQHARHHDQMRRGSADRHATARASREPAQASRQPGQSSHQWAWGRAHRLSWVERHTANPGVTLVLSAGRATRKQAHAQRGQSSPVAAANGQARLLRPAERDIGYPEHHAQASREQHHPSHQRHQASPPAAHILFRPQAVACRPRTGSSARPAVTRTKPRVTPAQPSVTQLTRSITAPPHSPRQRCHPSQQRRMPSQGTHPCVTQRNTAAA